MKQARKWRVLGLDRIVKKGCYLNKYQGNGGGVGVTPTKLKVPGSIPIVDWIFPGKKSVFTLEFSLSAMWQLPWTSGFPVSSLSLLLSLSFIPCAVCKRHTYIPPSSSLLTSNASCTKKLFSFLSLCTVTVSVGTGRNWRYSSTVEAEKKYH